MRSPHIYPCLLRWKNFLWFHHVNFSALLIALVNVIEDSEENDCGGFQFDIYRNVWKYQKMSHLTDIRIFTPNKWMLMLIFDEKIKIRLFEVDFKHRANVSFFLKCYDIYTLSWKTKTLVLVVWERHRHEGLLGKCYTTAVIHNNNPDLLFVSTLEFRQCDSMKLKVIFPATLSLEPNNFHEKTWPYIQIESINESYTLII